MVNDLIMEKEKYIDTRIKSQIQVSIFPILHSICFACEGGLKLTGEKGTRTRNGMLGVALSLLAPKYRVVR